MTTSHSLQIAVITLACVSCRKEPQVLSIQVLRDSDAPYAKVLDSTTNDFAISKPRLISGKYVMVGTIRVGGAQFGREFRRLIAAQPELVILDSRSEMAKDNNVENQMGQPEHLCGGNVAYLPTWVSGEKRDAAEMYLRFVKSNCK
jgi:hypothetical protein